MTPPPVAAPDHRLTAFIEDLPNQTTRVTIGRISSIYANGGAARRHLERLQDRGQVRIVAAPIAQEGEPC